MAFLSNLFGSDDSDSANSNSSDFFSDLDAVLGLDISTESYSNEVDEDGNSETTYDSTDIGTDLDIGNVLASMTDSFSANEG